MLSPLVNTTHCPNKGLWKYGNEDGRARTVLALDGTNDYAVASFFDDLEGANSFTLAMRFKLDGAQTSGTKLFQHGDEVYSDPAFMLLELVTSGGDQHLRLHWFHGAEKSAMNDLPDFTNTDYHNRWMNLIIRWDKDTDDGRLSYRLEDNVLAGERDYWALSTISSYTHTSAIPALSGTDDQQKCVIGAHHIEGLGTIQHFDGKIADVALWDSRLTDAEADMYYAGFSPTGIANANLKHYWDLSGSGEDYGTATTRDEADISTVNGADLSGEV